MLTFQKGRRAARHHGGNPKTIVEDHDIHNYELDYAEYYDALEPTEFKTSVPQDPLEKDPGGLRGGHPCYEY